MKELISWIKDKGVRDLEKVPLYSEQLDKVSSRTKYRFAEQHADNLPNMQDAVQAIEKLADSLVTRKKGDTLKMAMINRIPRQALLKPEYASTRLREQEFAQGDRVVAVVESGNVPLSAKGVVIGIQANLIDVVFDVQFMSGTTLGDRYVSNCFIDLHRAYCADVWVGS